MKNASINIPSALGGAALLGLVLLVASAAQNSSQVVRIEGPVRIVSVGLAGGGDGAGALEVAVLLAGAAEADVSLRVGSVNGKAGVML